MGRPRRLLPPAVGLSTPLLLFALSAVPFTLATFSAPPPPPAYPPFPLSTGSRAGAPARTPSPPSPPSGFVGSGGFIALVTIAGVVLLACCWLCERHANRAGATLLSDPTLSDEEKIEELRRRGWARDNRGPPPSSLQVQEDVEQAYPMEELPPTARWLQLQREAAAAAAARPQRSAATSGRWAAAPTL